MTPAQAAQIVDGLPDPPARPADMPVAELPDVDVATMTVIPVGWTTFNHHDAFEATCTDGSDPTDSSQIGNGFRTDADGGSALAEFAGRACYQSWNKPNPATATNSGYLRHILEVGHLSVLEHGTVSFYITGISRSCTHELIRHRHFSYSQLSQRYVPGRDAPVVEPDVIAEDPYLHQVFTHAVASAQDAYAELDHALQRKFEHSGMPVTQRRKMARQAARSVLPNAAETRIVVTGNYRAWRHFIAMRATEHADVQIRALAVDCLNHLRRLAPNVFGDFLFHTLPDGTLGAASRFAVES